MKTTHTAENHTLNDLKNPGHGRAGALDQLSSSFTRAAYGLAAAASMVGAIGRTDLHAQQNGWIDGGPPDTQLTPKALTGGQIDGRRASVAGVTAPGTPIDSYLSLGRKAFGPYRLGTNGKIEGGLVGVQTTVLDTNSGQTRTVSGSGIIAGPQEVYTAAHCCVSRSPNLKVTEIKVCWTDNVTGTGAHAVTGKATALEGWGIGADRGAGSDFAVIITDTPIPSQVQPEFASARPAPGTIVELAGLGGGAYGRPYGTALAGFGILDPKDVFVLDLPVEDFFSITCDPSIVADTMCGSTGDSGGYVKAKQPAGKPDQIFGAMIASTSSVPGWTWGVDLTSDRIAAFRKKMIPNYPREISLETKDGICEISWVGPQHAQISISRSGDFVHWQTVPKTEMVEFLAGGQRYGYRLQATSSISLFQVNYTP